MTITTIAAERRHTLYFLRETKVFAPVFLDTEVDATAIRADRRYSPVTHVLHAAGRVLAKHPEANAAILDGIKPRVARYESVTAKLTLDKTINGRRVVLAGLLPNIDQAPLEEIQAKVRHYRDADPHTAPEFAGVRKLHSVRWAGAYRAFRKVVRPLERRSAVWGTVSVTSLGHRPVDAFHSVGGTTITLGLGRITDRAVARDGELAIAPVLRLSLAFDHRVIDGAEAADVLAEIKEALENHEQ